MKPSYLPIALFIAFGFATWPIIGKYSQASGAWVGTVAAVMTSLVVVVMSCQKLTAPFPTTKAWLLLVFAGALNGVACYVYAVKTADPAVPSGIFVVCVAVLLAVCAALLDWALNGSVPTLRQITGFICAGASIYLLGR